jgi:hypothetical protein
MIRRFAFIAVLAVGVTLLGSNFIMADGPADGAWDRQGASFIATAEPDTVSFTAITYKDPLARIAPLARGVIEKPNGLVLKAKKPFRYRCIGTYDTDGAVHVPVDTVYMSASGTAGHFSIEYPCVEIIRMTQITTLYVHPTTGDTVWGRTIF